MTIWLTSRFRIDLTRTQVMGIVNVTPDSFSDGGQYASIDAAIAHCERLCEQGADILDIGGESTRPGAHPPSARGGVRPRHAGAAACAEPGRPRVGGYTAASLMRDALAAGADIINDVSALRGGGAEQVLAAHPRAGVCLMHLHGEPASMQRAPHYDDVAAEVTEFLAERAARLQALGVVRERIALDPGFGFGKTLAHNIACIGTSRSCANWGTRCSSAGRASRRWARSPGGPCTSARQPAWRQRWPRRSAVHACCACMTSRPLSMRSRPGGRCETDLADPGATDYQP